MKQTDVKQPYTRVSETSNYYLRNSQNISQQANKLALLQQSFFPSTIKLWNTLDLNIRQIPILARFKSKIRQIYFQKYEKIRTLFMW